tara:strand:+ start:1108 stop:1416 length:309 start_codon:yes stop_codon:yes gene_type:complete
MSIQNVDSAPDYIMKFIHMNMEQLCNIYDEGLNNNPDLDKGIMVFQCSQEKNKMDVQFYNDEMMCEILEKESVMNLKNNIAENKKLFFIQDLDLNSIFLIQV